LNCFFFFSPLFLSTFGVGLEIVGPPFPFFFFFSVSGFLRVYRIDERFAFAFFFFFPLFSFFLFPPSSHQPEKLGRPDDHGRRALDSFFFSSLFPEGWNAWCSIMTWNSPLFSVFVPCLCGGRGAGVVFWKRAFFPPLFSPRRSSAEGSREEIRRFPDACFSPSLSLTCVASVFVKGRPQFRDWRWSRRACLPLFFPPPFFLSSSFPLLHYGSLIQLRPKTVAAWVKPFWCAQ